jgi:hypothetical protein
VPDRRMGDWASLMGWVRSAGAAGARRVALAAGSVALSAAAVGGVVVTAQPAGATVHAAAVRAAATATCSPRINFLESKTNSGAGAWPGHFCGMGYRHPWHRGQTWEHFQKIWDASSPYYRVWFHENGRAWCAWGPTHKTVPHAFKVPGNILITQNSSPCPKAS